jgi:hypothetical protein
MYIDKAVINYHGMPLEVQVDGEYLTLVRKDNAASTAAPVEHIGMNVDELRDVIALCELMGWEGVKAS